MKTLLSLLLITSLSLQCYAQYFELKINGVNNFEDKTIDSIPYLKKHKTTKSLTDEIELFSKKLTSKGFIDNQIITNNRINDSTFIVKFDLKEKINSIHIYIDKENPILNNIFPNTINNIITIRYEEIESFLNKKINQLEHLGYAFTKLKLTNIQRKKNTLYADISIKNEKKREINSIVLNYTQSNQSNIFPKGHLKQIKKKYTGKTFNQETTTEIYNDFEKFTFVKQSKFPEILFSNDSTKIYIYIEKRKSNTFDGYIGFSNNENKKITLNGYLDINLENTLHSGEQFSLYWKSDGNKQTTFKSKIEIPYLFKTPTSLKAELEIFKQDSIFQNTKTAIALGYYIKYNSHLYIGYQSTESSDIQNTNSALIQDYKNHFTTTTFEYKKTTPENFIFPTKTNINITAGLGKRTNTNNTTEDSEENKQHYANIDLINIFYINIKNSFYIRSKNYYLWSNTYLTNELYRFGGINSIRGFAENSLQANNTNLLITEYRYQPTPNLYLHTIADYGLYQDKTTPENKKKLNNLIGIGIGLGILTRNGLLQITLANGSTSEDRIKFYNSILNIQYNVKF
ncbi:ShlB/FhaC/HecB family hemolysin secretion/activation protein [Flavobacterium sp. AJR]|uniref:ShlB/FhaC/HecB family hemolysin secretion/activation protein n=1 Tax=Flavobacterium sp. AJR TaxID=1979369 RepID=UPI001F621A27|nr:ShlB/FhaC/HecB family hemolysin secretion/activation protein [Flavobacterium sp. AJR]